MTHEMVKLPKKIIRTNLGWHTLDLVTECLPDYELRAMCTSTSMYFYFDFYTRNLDLLVIVAIDKQEHKNAVVYVYKDELIEPIEKALSEGIVESKKLR